jgi:hypothetical protein
MKKLVLISLVLLVASISIMADAVTEERQDAVVNSAPIDYKDNLVPPIDRISDDVTDQFNSAPIDYKDNLVPPIDRISDDVTDQFNAAPINYRENLVPPIEQISDDITIRMQSNPRGRREGIIIPPIHFDPFDHSKNENAVRIDGLTKPANVMIYNLLGKKMIDTETSEFVSTKELPSGRYIMIVKTDNEMVSGKITVIK